MSVTGSHVGQQGSNREATRRQQGSDRKMTGKQQEGDTEATERSDRATVRGGRRATGDRQECTRQKVA